MLLSNFGQHYYALVNGFGHSEVLEALIGSYSESLEGSLREIIDVYFQHLFIVSGNCPIAD